jgi:uncharacterized integral membrane protein
MSASAQTPGTPAGAAAPKRDKRSKRELRRNLAVAVLAILITLFAVFNFNEVKVSYVFGSGKAPLIIVIVISLLVGILITYLGERLPRKRR